MNLNKQSIKELTFYRLYVPSYRKDCFKVLVERGADHAETRSCWLQQIMENRSKPRHDQIFDRRQLCWARYRKALRDRDKRSTMTYTNNLHEALITKDGPTFWNCWRSKFELHKM